MSSGVYFGFECKDERMWRHRMLKDKYSCLIIRTFSFTTADVAKGQFEVTHWLDLAEALTASLAETILSGANHNQWFALIELCRNRRVQITQGKSFLLSVLLRFFRQNNDGRRIPQRRLRGKFCIWAPLRRC